VARGVRGSLSGGSRSVVAQIDEQLKSVEAELARHEELLRERERLRAARATLLGAGPAGQVSQEDVAAYVAKHPGSRPRDIAAALGVSSGRVSAHLFRGKTSRFVSRDGGWYVR
jgi:hypothetical protein